MTEEITVYDPRLPSTPGWVHLTETEKKWLVEHNSRMDRFGSMAAGGALGAAVELYLIVEGLDGKSLNPTRFIKTKFSQSEANGWKMVRWIRTAIKNGYDVDKLEKIRDAMINQGVSTGYELGEIVNTLAALPAPKGNDTKTIEGFVTKDLKPALFKGRSQKRKGNKKITLSDDKATAPPLMFNACRLILKNYKELTSAERKHIIKSAVGWLMEEFAIPGTIQIARLSIPEEVKPRPVGRPREMGK